MEWSVRLRAHPHAGSAGLHFWGSSGKNCPPLSHRNYFSPFIMLILGRLLAIIDSADNDKCSQEVVGLALSFPEWSLWRILWVEVKESSPWRCRHAYVTQRTVSTLHTSALISQLFVRVPQGFCVYCLESLPLVIHKPSLVQTAPNGHRMCWRQA